MLEEDLTVGEGTSIELVITFDSDTPEPVIWDLVERARGEVVAFGPVFYITLGFDDADAALRAADYLGDHEAVVACMPQTALEY